MRILDSISGAGKPANEDLVRCREGAYALVLDGASGLVPNVVTPYLDEAYQTDAQWLATAFAALFDARWDTPSPLPQVVDLCLHDLKAQYDSFPISPEQRELGPSASLAVFRASDAGGELFLLGDCTAVLSGKAGTRELRDPAVSRLDNQALELGDRLSRELGCSRAEAMRLEPVRAKLRENRSKRNHMNLPDGYAILAPEEGLARYGIYEQVDRREVTYTMMVTDGLAANYQVYGITPTPDAFLTEAQAEGLAALLNEQRIIEEADPDCARFLRFKKGDDASGVLLEL